MREKRADPVKEAETMLAIATIVVSVVVLGYASLQFYRAVELLKITTTGGVNDHDRARAAFRELLDEADDEMILYDDGNSMEGSIYEDRAVVDAIRRKLDENPGFTMECMFSFSDETLFRRELGKDPRITIMQRKGVRSSVHYKIIDGGRKAYVSRHELGQERRSFKNVDATKANQRARKDALGELFTDFQENHA